MKKPTLLSLILNKPFLNAFRLDTSTVRWSSRFYQLTTVFKKMPSDSLSLVHRVFLNFKQWPLVPIVFSSNINSSSIPTRDSPLKILNNSIRFRLFLLFSKVHNPRYLNLSSYDLPSVQCSLFRTTRALCVRARSPIITALHVMQTRYCDENSVCPWVCPSVSLSVTRVYCDKTVKRSVQIYTPYERTFSLVFWEEEWLVGGDPFYLKFWVNRPPLERNRRFSTNNRS